MSYKLNGEYHPQCFGAIDGCHIPICAPSEQHTDLQSDKLVFNDFSGTPKCMLRYLHSLTCVHDARVFAH